MASGFLLNIPKFQAFDANGDPLAGGLVYTYAQGTTTPKATYSDKNCTTPNANPVVLDSRGEATIYLDGYYKILLKTAAGVTIWTMDNIVGIGYTALTGVTLADYGGDLAAAVSGIGSTETTLYIDTDCTVTGNLTIPATIALDIKRSGAINPNSGVTVTINGAVLAGAYAIFGGSGTVAVNTYPKLKAWWGSGTITGIIATVDVGTIGLFGQNTAPTGWTIDVNHTDCVLALKGGSGKYNANGGTSAGSWTHIHAGGSHTHTGPSHTHELPFGTVANGYELRMEEDAATGTSVSWTDRVTGSADYPGAATRARMVSYASGTGVSGTATGDVDGAKELTGESAGTWRPLASLCIRATKD